MLLVPLFSLTKEFVQCPLIGLWRQLRSTRLANGITQSFNVGRASYPCIWQQHRAHCACGSRTCPETCMDVMDPNNAVISWCTLNDVMTTLLSMVNASLKPGYLYKLQSCLDYQVTHVYFLFLSRNFSCPQRLFVIYLFFQWFFYFQKHFCNGHQN